MELRQLATFRMVATTLSFTRAAAALNYVQSSVTAQIQALEEELGVPLFNRIGRRVTLTDAGRSLLGYAERMLDLADEARTVVSASDEPTGVLTIAAPETLCTYRLPAVLRQFQTRFPRVKLILRPNPVGDLARDLAGSDMDAAFLIGELLPSGRLQVESLVREPLTLVAAPEHPLARASRVRPADLCAEQVLLTENGCSYRSAFERTLAAAGVTITSTLEFSSVEAIKQCVMAGMGISVLPAVTVATELAQGRLAALRWSERNFSMVTQMIWHKDRWLSPALNAFLEVTRAVLHADANADAVTAEPAAS